MKNLSLWKKASIITAISLPLILGGLTIKNSQGLEGKLRTADVTAAEYNTKDNLKSFYGGDFEVTEDNIYTKLHKYQKDDKTITFATVNHYGSKEYFKKIEHILDQCDCVLYEGGSSNSNKENKKEEAIYQMLMSLTAEEENSLNKTLNKYPELKERYDKIKHADEKCLKISLLDPQKAFYFTCVFYMTTLVDKNIVQSQGEHINVEKPRWEHCDIISKEDWQKVMKGFFKNLYTKADEKKLVDSTVTMLEGMVLSEKKQIDYKHMVEVFRGGYGELMSTSDITAPLVRETSVMKETLKKKLSDDKIKTIGIIYGAGHGPNIRSIIESLQFEKTETTTMTTF